MQIDRSQPPDLLERIGIVIWKIAVLVIALRGTLALVAQQGVLAGLSVGSMVLQSCALVLIAAGGGWAIIRALRGGAPGLARPGSAPRRPGAARPESEASLALRAAQGMQHMMWRGTNWMLALGLESMLAAQIIQVSIVSVGQSELSWWRLSVVIVIALSRILI
jgi:hypothetical protein